MANPRKKTPEMREALLECLRNGLSLNKSYLACGIGKKTVQDWRKEDPTLEDDIEQAKAQGAKEMHDRIMAAGKAGDWKADAWMLDKRFPEDYSKTERTEVSIVLDMPGLLPPSKGKAKLIDLTDADWKEMDKRAEEGKLLPADFEILGMGEEEEDGED